MSEEVRLDIVMPRRKYEELVEFIDKHKDTRRSSKRFYGTQIAEMGHRWMEKMRSEQELTAKEFRELRQKINSVLD